MHAARARLPVCLAEIRRSRTAVLVVVTALVAGVAATLIGAPKAAADPTVAGGYVATPPLRLLDTRIGLGSSGPVAGGSTLTVQVTGRGAVPATGVGAAAVTVTVTQPTGAGYVTAYAADAAPPATSNLNYAAGQTVANLVLVPVSATGAIALHVRGSGTVQVLADLAGYYTSGPASDPGSFTPMTPTRLLDTRTGLGARAGPVAGGSTVALQVAGAAGIPATGVGAVALTVTVTQATGGGYVTAFADGTTLPYASNLDFGPGQTVANLVVVPTSNGVVDLHVAASGTVQLIADVAGYYLDGTPSGAGSFAATTPTRVLDTRTGLGAAAHPVTGGTPIPIQVAGVAGAPATGLTAVALTVTVTQPSAGGFVTAVADGAGEPDTSNINFIAGQTVANLVIAPVAADGKIDLDVSTRGHVEVIADMDGYYLGPPADTTPPGPVTALTVSATETTASLSWQDPAAPDLQGIMIRRLTGGTPPAGPASGTLIASLPPTATSYTDTTVDPQTVYSYAVFSYDAEPNYSAASVSATTASLTFQTGQQVDPYKGMPQDISCPTTTFCMSVDMSGQAISEVNGRWQRPVRLLSLPGNQAAFLAVSCPYASFCAAVAANGTAFVYRSGTWSSAYSVYSGQVLRDVSCISATFCMVATANGRASRWNGTAWSAPVAVPGGKNSLGPIACGSSSFCVAFGWSNNRDWAWRWNGSTWSGPVEVLYADGDEFWDVSCVGTRFCIADGDNGYYLRWNGTAWSRAVQSPDSGFDATSISCTSTTFCVAIGSEALAVAASSRFTGTTWTSPVNIDLAATGGAVACVSTTCTEVDGNGVARHGNGQTWSTPIGYDLTQGTPDGVSCASRTFCLAVDEWSNYLVYNGSSWSAPRRISLGVPGLGKPSCVTTTFCLALDSRGETWVFDGTRWTARARAPVTNQPVVSCASTTYCLAASDGAVSVFNGSTWSHPLLLAHYAQSFAVSCTRSRLCAVLDLASTVGPNYRLDVLSGGRWTSHSIAPSDYPNSVTCADPGFCLLGIEYGALIYRNGTMTTLYGVQYDFDSVGSCLSATYCVVTDQNREIRVFNGSTFGDPAPSGVQPPDDIFGLSCVAPTFCAAVGTFGATTGS